MSEVLRRNLLFAFSWPLITMILSFFLIKSFDEISFFFMGIPSIAIILPMHFIYEDFSPNGKLADMLLAGVFIVISLLIYFSPSIYYLKTGEERRMLYHGACICSFINSWFGFIMLLSARFF